MASAALPPTTALVAVGVIEKDTNKDVALNWFIFCFFDRESLSFLKAHHTHNSRMYPAIEEDLEKVIISRSNLTEDNIEVPFVFSKYKGEWHYILTVLNDTNGALTRVTAFSICLVTKVSGKLDVVTETTQPYRLSKVFCPEKYALLCKLFANLYSTSGSPLKILEAYVFFLKLIYLFYFC